MKRRQLFEFEDFARFPSALRDDMTSLIETMHRLLGTDKLIAGLVAEAMRAGDTNEIIDLCSGAGGPMLRVLWRLRRDHGLSPRLTLTDLHPNREAMAAVNSLGDPLLSFKVESVDASRVPEELRGVRTMVCSFHHMPPAAARAILKDAFDRRIPLCVFEVGDNSQPAGLTLAALPLAVMAAYALTPLARPWTLRRALLTYALPVVPAAFAWDGIASGLRIYAAKDLAELLEGLAAPDYVWRTGTLTRRGLPIRFQYLLGLPNSETGGQPHG